MEIQIKNMVCPRCIRVVQSILDKMGIGEVEIRLGWVKTEKTLSNAQLETFKNELKEEGFELLEDSSLKVVERIKNLIIERIHFSDNVGDKKLISEFLSAEIGINYKTLSQTFHQQEGETIERYVIKQRIEKVKELLSYGEMSLKEIAFDLGYSSTSHLSNQFKKEEGITPKEFVEGKGGNRKPLSEI
ncbi:helix-turn-helix domain-containing protein [Prolixibacteraceae bacterium JC049]|nr:helix-turn-helix domain-containing protein [Prolixibacteraceae bacterium JC049]